MRRFVLAAAAILTNVSPSLAQAPVQKVPRTEPETATAHDPVPTARDNEHPSTPNPAGAFRIVPQEKEPTLPIRPATRDDDQLTGHLRLGAAIAYGTLSGSFRSDASIGSNLGGSTFLLGDLGYGLSRHLELVVTADYSDAAEGTGCSSLIVANSSSGTCDAKSWSVGPALRYHLVEGTRFSPWLSLGIAYRSNHIEYPGRSPTIKSLDVLRLSIGGDWYATSMLAFGPVFGFGLATSYSPPAEREATTFAWVHGGVRLLFDVPGR